MSNHDEIQQRASSIEVLVGKLEKAADPELRSAAKDLVQALMELHGAGLERILEIVRDGGDPGNVMIERFGRDELVRSVLLLYGLHPEDLRTRVLQALDSTQSFLNSHGATAELASCSEAGAVTVHFKGTSGGCGSTAASLKSRIVATLHNAAPDAASIVVEDKGVASQSGVAFVSISELQSGQTMTALSAHSAQRSGN